MGTNAWANWIAFESGQPEIENVDDELHSDRSFIGGPVTFGPYEASIVFRAGRPGTIGVGAAVRLRLGVHADLTPNLIEDGELVPANSEAYHGGAIGDELASLVSLLLGVRLRYAGRAALSGLHSQGDRTRIHFEVPPLSRPGPPGVEQLPAVQRRTANLNDLDRLTTYPRLPRKTQIELARAARAYASALWWANEDPNQAWLQLVTAVEIAATRRQKSKASHQELLESAWPELWKALSPAEERVRLDVARLLSHQIRATQKFVSFLVECTPEPPDLRPSFGALNWDAMADHARLIYGHRSKALHGGKPFPLSMLEEPRVNEDDAIQEAPFGHSTGGLGGIWDAAEAPMLLSTFEYIARGSLLRWWDEAASTAGQS